MLQNCFLICKNNFGIGESLNKYNKVDLNYNNIFLFYNEIKILKFKNNKNQDIYLIGVYFFSNEKHDESIFLEINYTNITNILSAIVGNYIVIYDNHIYMDATGQFGIDYSYSNQTCYITNNISVFKEIGLTLIDNTSNINSHPTNTVDSKKFTSYKYNFYIPPETQFSNVKSLLPSEIISLEGEIIYNNIFHYSNPALLLKDYGSIINLCSKYLQTVLKNIYNHCKLTNNDIYLPLTSGYDSRVLLATFKSINIPVKTFTIIRDKAISKSDKMLPPILSKKCGYSHFFINITLKKNNINKKLLNKWNYIIGRNHTGVDREYYIRDVFNFAKSGDFILTGHGFELVTNESRPKHYNSNTIISHWKNRKLSLNNITTGNHLYVDGCLGGWLKYITSSFTIEKNIHRIYPINCRDILCNLLNLPKSIRDDGKNKINKQLIEILYPKLNNFKYN